LGVDEVMGRCVLSPYRSAGQPVLAEWRSHVPAAAARPGLIVIPTGDAYTGAKTRHRCVVHQIGAEIARLPSEKVDAICRLQRVGRVAGRHILDVIAIVSLNFLTGTFNLVAGALPGVDTLTE
jgi:hypothetical protein